MNIILITVALAALAILLLLTAVFGYQRLRQQAEQLGILQQQFDAAQSQNQQLHAELEELRSGLIGVGQRVLKLQERQQGLRQDLDELQQQQQVIALSDPESKIYSRAVKMVELGADLEEIIRECELPRAEAELLFNLHRQQRGQ